MTDLLLASGSPRRRSLLEMLGVRFDVVVADVDERYPPGEPPRAHAERLAREKAAAVAAERPAELVIGADTVVVVDGDVLGKPVDEADAVRMLMRLQGREHMVMTGVAVARGSRVRSAVESVAVRFRAFDDAAARAYVATGEPMDKAGAYGIQGFGSTLVESIRGDFFAVMGLPIVRLLALLEAEGWQYAFGHEADGGGDTTHSERGGMSGVERTNEPTAPDEAAEAASGGLPKGALEPVRWSDPPGAIEVLDQTRLPEAEVRLRLETVDEVVEAIRSLRVRGAPAIGIAAAMALALEAARRTALEPDAFERAIADAYAALVIARPTAVNLRWALDRLLRVARSHSAEPNGVIACKLWGEATSILEEDRAMSRRIGELGLELVPDGARVLTHCNAGALATGGLGTALAPIYLAAERGRRVQVFATETRPLMQGSRLTAWELARADVPVTLLVDSAAASLLKSGGVDLVMVGADRIALNGDVANKVGTYALALLARAHGVPFFVAAPTSTLDPAMPDGDGIEIESRDPDEVRRGFGRVTAPVDVPVYAPAFDVTPNELVNALVTDAGVLRAPYGEAIQAVLNGLGGGEGEGLT